jgi:hypothetical protein
MSWALAVHPGKSHQNLRDKPARFEVLVLQLLPTEAYLDLDELRERHDFRAAATLWFHAVNDDDDEKKIAVTARTCSGMPVPMLVEVTGVESGSLSIDIERPAHVSPQHAVEITLAFVVPRASDVALVTLELTMPFHVRYPEPKWQAPTLRPGASHSCGSASSGADVHMPLLFIRLFEDHKAGYEAFLSPPFRLLEPAIKQSPIILPFPAGEGWRAGFVVVVTTLVHVAGLLWVGFTALE